MAMAPLQTTYPTTMAPFVKGMVPDMRSPAMDVSRTVEAAAGLGFGVAAAQGTADRQVKPWAAGGKFIGVTLLDTTRRGEKYDQYDTANVRQLGPVVVQPSVSVVAGDSAYIVAASGLFTNVATGNTLVGKFETSGAANSLVVLNLI